MDAVYQTVKDLQGDLNEQIAYLRAKAINYLAIRCTDIFMENKEKIINGEFEGDLLGNIKEAESVIKRIQKDSYARIYNYPSVVKIELAGFRIMSGLIEDFVSASLIPEDKRQKQHHKVLSLLPAQYHFEEHYSPYEKVMSVIDYVSGMTDLYALKLYRNMRGIEMPII